MTAEREDDRELAAARDEVLAAVQRMGERGGPSLRPASVHAESPLGAVAVDLGRERLTTSERQALSAAKRWQSRYDWFGGLSGSIERRLLIVACEIVGRIASGPTWSGAFDGPRPDLAAELDQLEEHAHDLARLRRATTRQQAERPETTGPGYRVQPEPVAPPDAVSPQAGTTTEPEDALVQGWRALVDRVAALALYGQRLADLDDGPDPAAAVSAEELAARSVNASVGDELAADHLRLLAQDLTRPQLD